MPERISYRVKEAAELTGTSIDTIKNMVASGELKVKKISPQRKGPTGRYMTMIPRSELVRVFCFEEDR